MQKLTKGNIGESYTIKWLFGLPEVLGFLHSHHVEAGERIQIIQKLNHGLIIGVQDKRLALSNEIADRIQV